MYEDITQELLLNRMLSRVEDTMDKRPSALIYDTHSAAAIELKNLYIELEYLVKNSFGDTAAREYLILLCKDRGITPEPATKAILKGVFYPPDIDVTDQRFNIGEVNYVVKEKLSDGEYTVECESEGTVGNQYLGDMIPMEYIRGLQTAELTELLIPGEDEEDTEVLRKRYLESFDAQAFGGNRADYLKKVNSINGVGSCKVTRVWNGDIRPAEMIPDSKVTGWYRSLTGLDENVSNWLGKVYSAASGKKLTVGGSVLITITNANDYGTVSDTLCKEVQNVLDPEENCGEGYGLAPIGHVVLVQSVTAVPVAVKTSLVFEEGYNWSRLKSQITKAVEEYLLELRKKWADSGILVVRISQIESRILNVPGIADLTKTKINGKEENLTIERYDVPVLGGVENDQGS